MNPQIWMFLRFHCCVDYPQISGVYLVNMNYMNCASAHNLDNYWSKVSYKEKINLKVIWDPTKPLSTTFTTHNHSRFEDHFISESSFKNRKKKRSSEWIPQFHLRSPSLLSFFWIFRIVWVHLEARKRLTLEWILNAISEL